MNPIRQTRARHPIRAGAAIIAALCVLTVGCSMIVATPSSHPLAVTDSDNGKRFTLSPGDHLEVSLSAIPGTGYIWEITDNDWERKCSTSTPALPAPQSSRWLIGVRGRPPPRPHAPGLSR